MGNSKVFSIHFALLIFGFLFLNLANAQSTPTPIQLPEGYDWKYNPENGHYYTVIKMIKTWDEAKVVSESLGGYLATITSSEENEWIFNLLALDGIIEAWIGLYYSDNNNWQ